MSTASTSGGKQWDWSEGTPAIHHNSTNTNFALENLMAWEISISADGWTEIRQQLELTSRVELIAAIADDKFELVYASANSHHAERAAGAERKRLQDLPHDILVDRAFELIQENNTCDNGGFAYWIDRAGYHKVVLPDK